MCPLFCFAQAEPEPQDPDDVPLSHLLSGFKDKKDKEAKAKAQKKKELTDKRDAELSKLATSMSLSTAGRQQSLSWLVHRAQEDATDAAEKLVQAYEGVEFSVEDCMLEMPLSLEEESKEAQHCTPQSLKLAYRGDALAVLKSMNSIRGLNPKKVTAEKVCVLMMDMLEAMCVKNCKGIYPSG